MSVVIDPEDREQIAAFVAVFTGDPFDHERLIDAMQAAFREYGMTHDAEA